MSVEINVSEISQASGYLYNWDCVVRQVLCGKKTPEEEASVKSGVEQVACGEKATPEEEASVNPGAGQVSFGDEEAPEEEASEKSAVEQVLYGKKMIPEKRMQKMSKKVKKLLTKTEAGDNIMKLSERDSKKHKASIERLKNK